MEKIINDLLGYEGMKIIQSPEMFNFSLDSTILAYYISINKSTKTIVDMGCGNGYIPLFLTLRTKAHIFGVEIQKDVADLAKESVSLNKLDEQITIINEDLKTVHNTIGVAKADIVTCNPPFFKYKETSLINNSDYKTIARHEVLATLDDICHEANILLKDGGTFGLVHRVDRMIECIETLKKYSLEPKKILFVYPTTDSKEAQGIYIESKKSNNIGGLKVLPPLYVYDNGKYTKDILKIFNYNER